MRFLSRVTVLASVPFALLACSVVSDFDGLVGTRPCEAGSCAGRRFCDDHPTARLCLDFDGPSDAGAVLPSQLILDPVLFSSPPNAAKFAVTELAGDAGRCAYEMITHAVATRKRVITIELDVRVGDAAGKKLQDLYFLGVNRGCQILFGGDGVQSLVQVQPFSTPPATGSTKLGGWSHVKMVLEGGAAPALQILVDGVPSVARITVDPQCVAAETVELKFGFFCYDRSEGANEVRLDNVLVVDSD